MPFLLTERLFDRGAERNADIFCRVVEIDMQVALGRDRHVDQRMPRQLVEHVIEKTDARLDVVLTGSVEVHLDGYIGFIGLADDLGAAHACLFAGSCGL